MALDSEDAREMVLEIINQIDYDIYKEILSQIEDEPDEWNLFDDCMNIVEKYVKVNP
ncbi:hypothetical protein D3C85_755630 [compost metagenome]